MAKEIEVKFPKPNTYEEAVRSQTWFYDSVAHPIAPQTLAELLNDYFNVDCFSQGKPRVANESAVVIKWPKWRAERKPIKMKLQEGIILQY